MKWASWINLILGIWLLISPGVLHVDGVLMNNNMACGVLAVLAAIWGLIVVRDNHLPGWVSLAIGLWVLVSPWVLAVEGGSVALANNGLCGSVMSIFAVLRLLPAPLPSRGIA